MTYINKLLYARYVAIFATMAVTAVTTAFAAKAIVQIKEDRKEASHIPGMKVTIDVHDMQSAAGAIVGTAGFGIAVALLSEVFLAIERRRGLSKGKRIFNELLLATSALLLLAACVVGTHISGRSAKFNTVPAVPQSVVDALLKSKGKSAKYRDSWAWKAVITGWISLGFLLLDLVLVIMAGLHYRRVARQRSVANSTPNRSDGKLETEYLEYRA